MLSTATVSIRMSWEGGFFGTGIQRLQHHGMMEVRGVWE